MKGRLMAAAAVALVAAAAGGFGAPGTFGNPAGTFAEAARSSLDRPQRAPRAGGHHNLAGWTNRRYQRAAAKLRNQKRNRRQHRG